MKTYKLFRIRNGKLYPLYVEASREMIVGEWLNAGVGALVDETHVKASGCGGKLALRPGFHSTLVPFTDWIGKKMADGTLAQRKLLFPILDAACRESRGDVDRRTARRVR